MDRRKSENGVLILAFRISQVADRLRKELAGLPVPRQKTCCPKHLCIPRLCSRSFACAKTAHMKHKE